jgi:hypothetical protein
MIEVQLTGPAPRMSAAIPGLYPDLSTACQATASGSMQAPTSTGKRIG